MNLKFQKLTIRNFKCIEAVDLDYGSLPIGLIFVQGINQVEPALSSNGASKSSLHDALCWCLFGKTVGGLRNPDIRPWGSEEATVVLLALEVDGESYDVCRVTPNNILMVNDKEVSQDHIVNNIMSYPVFVNTLLLGQNRPLWFDLRPQEKMELFDDVLGLERWERWSEAAATEVKQLQKEEIVLSTELEAARASFKDMRVLYGEIKSEYDSWVESKTLRLARARAEAEGYRGRVKAAAARSATLRAVYDALIVALRVDRARLDEEQKDLHALQIQEQHEKTVNRQLKELEVKWTNARTSKVCPSCKQPIKNLEKYVTDKLVEIQLELEANNSKLSEISDDIVVALDLVKGTSKVIEDREAEIKPAAAKLNEAVVLHTQLTGQLTEANNQIELWSGETNPHSDKRMKVRARLRKLKARIQEIKSQLQVLRIGIDSAKFWVSGFKACRLYLLEEVLEELKLVSNSILPELGLEGWELGYEIEKENKSGTITKGLNVTISSLNSGGPVRFESYSGGEQQRLRLIGALALSEVLLNYAGIQSDLEILDEPTRSLSQEGVRDLCEALPARAERLNRRTLYTDHQVTPSSYFASILTVVRKKSGVQILYNQVE